MSDKPVKIDALAWKKLARFAEQTTETPWDQVAREMGMNLDEARRLMVALKEAQAELVTHTGENEDVFQAMNWTQWCQLTHLLEDLVKRDELIALRPMIIPVLKQHRQHPAYPVYLQLRQRFQESQQTSSAPQLITTEDAFTNHKIRLIEESILQHDTILAEQTSGKILHLIPCKLTYLEGSLALIAEEVHDHSLMALDINEITNIKHSDKVKAPRAGAHEVAEFISALRSMSDNEVRLVLKIKSPDHFALMPDYQFLGKPCLVTNAEGDLIWAAWVEPCDELFDWLSSMEQFVEILEPSEFVLDYAAYCEEKLRKLA